MLAWEGQTDPWKTSADCRMIAIIDDEELVKEEGISNYTPKYTNKHIVGSVSTLNGRRNATIIFVPNHWRQ